MTKTPVAALVELANQYCIRAHAGQTRDDGRDYATHPQAVAEILRSAGVVDAPTLAAALLHDVIEDTQFGEDAVRAEFGDEVVGLVLEVTNVGPPGRPFEEKQRALLEHCRVMTLRAKCIKLADRLHNLSEMVAWPAWKQARYARATVALLEALRPWPENDLGERVTHSAEEWLRRVGEEAGRESV